MRIDFTHHGVDLALLSERELSATEVLSAVRAAAGEVEEPNTTKTTMTIRHGSVLPATRTEPVSGLEVRVVGGPGAGRRARLRDEPVRIGRDDRLGVNEIVVEDAALSRRHAVVEVDRDLNHSVTITDLGSTNAVNLAGDRIASSVLSLGQLVKLGNTVVAVEPATQVPATVHWRSDGIGLVNRPRALPQRAPDPPLERVVKPVTQPAGRVAWLAALLPAAFGIVLAWQMHNPQFLLFMLASPLMMLGSSAGDRLSLRRHGRRALRDYRDELARQDLVIVELLAAEAAERRRRMADPTTIADIAGLPAGRLWEADATQALSVRVGLGSLPSQLQVRQAGELAAAGRMSDVPVSIDLASGSVGICGPAERRRGAARWLLCQLATRFSPAELDVAVVVDSTTEAMWHWLRWLPHLAGTDWVAREPAQWVTLAAQVDALVIARGTGRPCSGTVRRTVVLVDVSTAHPQLSALAECLRGSAAAGVSSVWLANTEQDLPTCCVSCVRVTGDTGAEATVTDPDGTQVGVLLDVVDPDYADSLARSLAPLLDSADRSDQHCYRPARLVDLLGLRDLEPAQLGKRWSDCDDGACTVIGTGQDENVALDLVGDGPHTLIAGTTGSGKSELLQSLVAGLAASYPPDSVSFVLIDYKGGAAFGECAQLPHVTGLVTDLDHHLTRRALRSLDAELSRREQLFADAGSADLAAFRRAGHPGAPARLVIVVDEFAALAEELPDFVTGLVSIAQRGRSLGIHLVLATQRPGSVVSAEIRANAALRIALRVTDPAESTDVIGQPDAATITRHQPGRAYLARDGELTHVQVARVTTAARVGSAEDQARLVPLGPWRELPLSARCESDKTDLAVLCAAICEQWLIEERPEPHAPWLAPLPDVIAFDELPPAGPGAVSIGLTDLPDRQRQLPYELASGGGPLLIAGAGRSGRSTALLTIALRAVAADRATGLYAIAPAGGPLTQLRDLPMCGTVATDAESAEALLLALLRAVEQRTHHITAGSEHCLLTPMVLLVDDYESFVAHSDDHDLGASVDRLLELIRACARAGMHLVIAGGRSILTPRLTGIVSERLVLRMADSADYATAGLRQTDVRALLPPGRAVRTHDGAEVALSLPHRRTGAVSSTIAELTVPATADPGRHQRSSELITIRPLPSQVSLDELPATDEHALTLGIAGNSAAPCLIAPFAGAGRLLIAGPGRSGRSTALLCLAQQAEVRGYRLLVAAPPRSALTRFALDHRLSAVTPNSGHIPALAGRTIVFIDDCEAFADTPIEAALQELIEAQERHCVIASIRTEDLAVSYRGLGVRLRRERILALLQPTSADSDLLGLRGRQIRTTRLPGRGLLIADPEWGNDLPQSAVPLQIASPGSTTGPRS